MSEVVRREITGTVLPLTNAAGHAQRISELVPAVRRIEAAFLAGSRFVMYTPAYIEEITDELAGHSQQINHHLGELPLSARHYRRQASHPAAACVVRTWLGVNPAHMPDSRWLSSGNPPTIVSLPGDWLPKLQP